MPVVTILVAVGIGVCIARWRSLMAGRALVTIWVVTLVMSFGRTTFGSLYDIVPGSSDVFIRRFQMGVQLSGILLAGVGLVFLGRLVRRRARWRLLPEDQRGWAAEPAGRGIVAGLCIVALVVVLYRPGADGHLRRHNATNIGLQAEADAQQDPQIDRCSTTSAPTRGAASMPGRPPTGATTSSVGAVPVFKYLESKDIDEVGYTLRTASLMTDPEYYFDDSNPGDYPLFGIGYIITPADMASPVRADKVGCAGDYCLWALPHTGYIHVYDTTGDAHGDAGRRRHTEHRPAQSPLLNKQRDLTVAFNGQAASPPTAADAAALQGSPGRVRDQQADLENGAARAVVHTNDGPPWCSSASYDPGWHATVNGRPAPTVMVAPALVGVVVGPGCTGSRSPTAATAPTPRFRPRRRGPGRPGRCTPGVAPDAAAGAPQRGDNGGP